MAEPRDIADGVEAAWRSARPDLDPSSVGIVTRIWHLAKLFGDHRRRLLAEHGIDAAQMDLLGTLRREGAPWTLTTRELAARTHITPGAVSQRVARAEERGWVSRAPATGRRVDVTLSPAGRRLADEIAADIFTADDELLAALSPHRRAQLSGLLRELTLTLDDGRVLGHVGGDD